MLGLASDIFVGLGTLAAAVTALVVAAVASRLLFPARLNERFGLAVAAATAFFVGYIFVFRWRSALAPEQAWEWLPYLGVVAASCAASVNHKRAIRWLVLAGLAIITASLLTPRWPIFGLSWPISIVVVAVYLLVIVVALDTCPPR